MACAGCAVCGQEHAAVDGGQGEPGKGADEQCLLAGSGEHEADARCDFGVFPELDRFHASRTINAPVTQSDRKIP